MYHNEPRVRTDTTNYILSELFTVPHRFFVFGVIDYIRLYIQMANALVLNVTEPQM